jgi:hypothetical protein
MNSDVYRVALELFELVAAVDAVRLGKAFASGRLRGPDGSSGLIARGLTPSNRTT